MTAPVTSTVVVAPADSLIDILGRIRVASGGGRQVRLEIPPGAALFLTASEFRTLKEAIDQERIALTVGTADPLRLQLARMLGLPTSAEERPAAPRAVPRSTTPPPRPAPRPAPETAPRVPSPGGAPPPSGSPAPPTSSAPAAPSTPPTPIGPESALTGSADPLSRPGPATTTPQAVPAEQASPRRSATAQGDDARVEGGSARATPPSTVESPPGRSDDPGETATARGRRLLASRLRRSAASHDALPKPVPLASVTDQEPEPEQRDVTSWAARLRPRSPVAWAATAVALALLAIAGVFLLLPRAEIAVTPRHQLVTGDIVLAVAAAGAPTGDADLTVAAAPHTLTVPIKETMQTTGSRREPDAVAQGTVSLSNPLPEAITIKKGTTVNTDTGVTFTFTADVKVPAGDAAANDFGTATGKVRAEDAGSAGNVQTGELGGKLPSGVYFSNREGPIGGGTDRRIPVVAKEDLQTLRDRAAVDLSSRAEATFTGELQDGVVLLPSTIAVGTTKDTFDHDAGEDAETITLTASRSVTALIFNRPAALDQARAELETRLAGSAPEGFAVDPASLKLADPAPIEEAAGGVRYRIAATAEARAVISRDEIAALQRDLAGDDPAAAEARLRTVPEIERFTIDYSPGWFPKRMPTNPKRIAIDVRS